MKTSEKHNILIVKHSSLGDWIKATGLFHFLRNKFKDSNIILITSQPYTQLAYSSGYFDKIWIDSREPYGSWGIFKKIRKHNYSYVFDLQSSLRSKMYRPFITCSNKYWSLERRKKMHDIEQFYDALKYLGIDKHPAPATHWLTTDVSHLNISKDFVLLIPGCSAKRKEKRWTATGYANVVKHFHAKNIATVIIGNEEDADITAEIMNKCANSPINLINKIGFHGISALAKKSLYIIGGDTGPVHIAAATGSKTIVLLTATANFHPEYCKPWGDNVVVIQKDNMNQLSHEHVLNCFH
jgi:ADP-heptose:LPS heptosyltransferase